MLRIAIVGCGKIADQHVQAIRRIPDCGIVSLCDREPLMARQLGERFGITDVFSDLAEMLKLASPDVVHITTPPQSHFALGRDCLQAGSHVYLEKPFTVTAEEAMSLITIAETAGLKITAGHNCQFTPEMIEMRRLVKRGDLGGRPVHLESHWSYDLGDASYVGPVVASKMHWVRRLPGQLLHNILSHGISRLAEFLDDELVEVHALARQSPQLARLGGQEVLDELRVLIWDGKGTSATFCFSTQIKPGLNRFRVCGPVNSLEVDVASGGLVRNVNRSYKSYLAYVLPELAAARQHLKNAIGNTVAFLTRRLYNDAGMKHLIEAFYRSIRTGGAPPIPHREILLTARIMDSIFDQIYAMGRAGEPCEMAPIRA